MRTTTLQITETFESLQGEGMLVGVPSFFIRTTGCNLRCAWCDTPSTSWHPTGRSRPVAELLEAAAVSGRRHVVVTGGEPLLQRSLQELTSGLILQGHHVTVETAGTVTAAFSCHLLSISPKTANSDPGGKRRERHRALREDLAPLRWLLERHEEYQLKFVVREEVDIPEMTTLVARLGADAGRVLLMPEGRTAAEVAARAPAVAAWCLQHGFRYSPRLHLDLFGGGPGV